MKFPPLLKPPPRRSTSFFASAIPALPGGRRHRSAPRCSSGIRHEASPIFLRAAGISLLASALSLTAGEIDASKLPPPAEKKIDFSQDIKPILEQSCIKCHGPEKPKSRFRLDHRESALQGGENN